MFQSLKLGRHTPITKAMRDGILKVGSKRAEKLQDQTEQDEWFSAIGDCPNSDLLRLYSKVCHHYLVPLLAQIPLDATLLKREGSSHHSTAMGPPDQDREEETTSKENIDPLQGEVGNYVTVVHCEVALSEWQKGGMYCNFV